MAEGSSWEDVGASLGTTKQAAWARFRHALHDQGGPEVIDSESRKQARQRAREVFAAGQARLREMDDRWRQERERLHEQIRAGKDALVLLGVNS